MKCEEVGRSAHGECSAIVGALSEEGHDVVRKGCGTLAAMPHLTQYDGYERLALLSMYGRRLAQDEIAWKHMRDTERWH